MKKALLPWQLVNHIVSAMRCKASWVNTHLPPCVTSSAGNGSFVEEYVQSCGTVQISLSLLQEVGRSNPKYYFCIGRFIQIYYLNRKKYWKKDQILNVFLGFASVKTMKPYNDNVDEIHFVPPAPEDHSEQHQKEETCCQHGGCQTCSSTSSTSSTSCCLWSCYPSSHLLHPSEGWCLLRNKDIWSAFNQAFCQALILSAPKFPALPERASCPPHRRGQPLKPCCSTDSPIHKASPLPSLGFHCTSPAALL